MVSKKEMRKFLRSQNIFILRNPRKPNLTNIKKTIEKQGFSIHKRDLNKLKRFIPLIQKHGLREIIIYAEKHRRIPEVHLETGYEKGSKSYYKTFLRLKKKRK